MPTDTDICVVVGHDRRPAGLAALAAAIELATRLGATLHVVHSITVDDYGIDPDSDEFDAVCERNRARERGEIETAMRATAVAWTYHEQRGEPARALAKLADEVDAAYLVVGATHPGALHHLVGGESVNKWLVRHQGRPVLVVPEPGSARRAHGSE
ncbi:MAG TPA: universal stress protein [Jatrophihabitans sp.]|jgi:nucleotide-binding universal stress UspA family protein